MFYSRRTSKSDAFRYSGGVPKGTRNVGNNTYEYVDATGARIIRLHTTDILAVDPHGKVWLNSGGWQTHTTKDRLNKHMPGPWRVVQRKHKWYVWNRRTNEEIEFEDGMVLVPPFDQPQ